MSSFVSSSHMFVSRSTMKSALKVTSLVDQSQWQSFLHQLLVNQARFVQQAGEDYVVCGLLAFCVARQVPLFPG